MVFRGHTGDVRAFAFSPDGNLILSASGPPGPNGTVRLWDPETGAEVRQFTSPMGHYRSVMFTPDGKQALTANNNGLVQKWDVAAGKEVQRHP